MDPDLFFAAIAFLLGTIFGQLVSLCLPDPDEDER